MCIAKSVFSPAGGLMKSNAEGSQAPHCTLGRSVQSSLHNLKRYNYFHIIRKRIIILKEREWMK